MNKGVLLAWWSGRRILPFSRIIVGILGGRTYHGEHIGTQSTHDDMQQYDACYDMAIWMCFGLMQAKTERNELIWIKDSNISSLNMALIVHFLILLKQQGELVLSCMKPLQMDRLNFSDNFSYINYFIWSYGWISMIFRSLNCFLEFPRLFRNKVIPENALLHQHYVSMT